MRTAISAASARIDLRGNGRAGSVRHMVAMPDTNHGTLAGRLNDGLIRRGISPRTLARRAGYTGTTTIRRYLAGETAAPSIEIVYRLPPPPRRGPPRLVVWRRGRR